MRACINATKHCWHMSPSQDILPQDIETGIRIEALYPGASPETGDVAVIEQRLRTYLVYCYSRAPLDCNLQADASVEFFEHTRRVGQFCMACLSFFNVGAGVFGRVRRRIRCRDDADALGQLYCPHLRSAMDDLQVQAVSACLALLPAVHSVRLPSKCVPVCCHL